MKTNTLFLSCAAIAAALAVTGAANARQGIVSGSEHLGGGSIVLVQGAMPGHTTAPATAPAAGAERPPGPVTGAGPMVTSPPGVVGNSAASGPQSPNSMPPGHMAADPNKK